LPTKSPIPPVTSPHFAGFISIFARDSPISCNNCDPEIFVNDSIDITASMHRLGLINRDNKKTWEPYSIESGETEESTGKDLHKRITLIPETLNGTKLGYEDVGFGLRPAYCWELGFRDSETSLNYRKLGEIPIPSHD